MVFLPFFIWHKKKLVKLHPEDVIYLITEGNYTKIVQRNQTFFMVRSTLSTALKKLPAEIFVRIHRSHAVSIFYIQSIHRDHIEINHESLAIGPMYYKPLVAKLNVME
jgi:DNA-binding LytR/AlgR family response regulator